MTDQEAAELLAQAATDTETAEMPPTETVTADQDVPPVNEDNFIANAIQQVQDNPESAAEVITQLQRKLGGDYGNELQKLRNEMARKEKELLARLETKPEPSSDEPDEHGMTEADYLKLGEIISKTPAIKKQAETQQVVERQNLDGQARQFLAGLKTQYGDAITEREIGTLYRAIKLANYDHTNLDLQDEYQETIKVVESRKNKAQNAISEEQNTKQQLQNRVNASYDVPRSSAPGNVQDIWKKSKGETGRTTDQSLIEAGRQYMKLLER